MYTLEIIKHKDLDKLKLDIIIDIKSKAWDYPYDKQKAWIENNINDKDLHILLKKQDEYIGYMNLINSQVGINGADYDIYGVGNVCAKEKGKGYGKYLMELSNEYIRNSNRIALLFCKDSLVNFYSSMGWELIEESKVELAYDAFGINTMIYNNYLSIDNLSYKGKAF